MAYSEYCFKASAVDEVNPILHYRNHDRRIGGDPISFFVVGDRHVIHARDEQTLS